MNRLAGKIALVTGGTSGIGAAAVKLFHAEGAQVVATGSSPASVGGAAQRTSAVEFLVSDASDPGAAQSLVGQIRDRFGRLDVLFINAGIARVSAIEDVDEAAFDRIMAVNVRGPYFLLKHASSLLVDGGSVILTSSLAGIRGIAELSAYGASKAALRSLGVSLAVEWAPRRIRVNTIVPGPIVTNLGAKMDLTPAQVAQGGKIVAKVPLSRMGNADEVAEAALYFASDESRFTTGAELTVDGGYTVV